MSDSHDSITGPVTRRGFLSAASAVVLTSGTLGADQTVSTPAAPGPAASSASARPVFAVDLLGLDPATRTDLETLAQPVLREARWLDELPLDDVRPAFTFDPLDGWK
jgi:hypothetical protein